MDVKKNKKSSVCNSAITIRNLVKNFEEKPVLKGISLDVECGKTTCIIGPSGCGKSVFLKQLVGLLHPDGGSIKYDDIEVSDYNEKQWYKLRSRLGMVFQNAALFDYLTVRDNVAFSLEEFTDLTFDEIEKKVEGTLNMVGLRKVGKLMPSSLSGGMRKRVGIARAIVSNPEIIFYDEPTSGLDPITSDVINDLIKNLNKTLNITAVVVTHDMKSAYKIGDKIAMMYAGRIRFIGTPDTIKNSTDPFVQQFIEGRGDGPISIIRQDTQILIKERKKMEEAEAKGDTGITYL